MGPMEEENYDAIKIAHGLHYASISILSVLVGEVSKQTNEQTNSCCGLKHAVKMLIE